MTFVRQFAIRFSKWGELSEKYECIMAKGDVCSNLVRIWESCIQIIVKCKEHFRLSSEQGKWTRNPCNYVFIKEDIKVSVCKINKSYKLTRLSLFYLFLKNLEKRFSKQSVLQLFNNPDKTLKKSILETNLLFLKKKLSM